MGYLRERMGKIVAGLIGFSLLAFIATEVIKSGGSFFKGDNNELGTVGDEKIPLDEFTLEYFPEFTNLLEFLTQPRLRK